VVHRFTQAMTRWRGRRGLAYVLILAAAIGGVAAIVVAITSQQSAPVPPASAAGTISSPPHSTVTPGHSGATPRVAPGTSTAGPDEVPSLPASIPAILDIPAIGVHTPVISVGKTPSGDLAVPQPGPDLNKAAWYRNSVTPGQDGPSVIEGHVDSVEGPSVFFKLGSLRPGDRVAVTRADRSVAVFTVNAVRSYASHADFPTLSIFGADLAEPTLRLITCSNFDASIGHYLGNTVVFAHLTAVRQAGTSH
jgi:sortase (surface protein transpeptidase)